MGLKAAAEAMAFFGGIALFISVVVNDHHKSEAKISPDRTIISMNRHTSPIWDPFLPTERFTYTRDKETHGEVSYTKYTPNGYEMIRILDGDGFAGCDGVADIVAPTTADSIANAYANHLYEDAYRRFSKEIKERWGVDICKQEPLDISLSVKPAPWPE